MTYKNDFETDYERWLLTITGTMKNRRSYSKLLELLHEIEFQVTVFMDKNRVADGKNLRVRYCYDREVSTVYAQTITGQVSVLEVLLALAIRCEEDLMADTSYGDRTKFWFWNMIESLGLLEYSNRNFEQDQIEDILVRFMDRDYAFNGEGGIYTIDDGYDTRDDELWQLMHRYIQNFL